MTAGGKYYDERGRGESLLKRKRWQTLPHKTLIRVAKTREWTGFITTKNDCNGDLDGGKSERRRVFATRSEYQWYNRSPECVSHNKNGETCSTQTKSRSGSTERDWESKCRTQIFLAISLCLIAWRTIWHHVLEDVGAWSRPTLRPQRTAICTTVADDIAVSPKRIGSRFASFCMYIIFMFYIRERNIPHCVLISFH